MHETHRSNVIIDNISDHYPSILAIDNPDLSNVESQQVTVHRINENEINKIKNKLNQTNWNAELNALNATEAFDKFHSKLTTILDSVAPEKIIKIRTRHNVPWFTLGIKKSNDKDKRLFKASQCKTATIAQKERYRTYHRVLLKAKQTARQLYYRQLCKEFKYNSQKLWKIIDSITGKTNNKYEIVDYLKIKNLEIHNRDVIATEFAKHFSNVGACYAKKIPTPKRTSYDYLSSIPSSNASLFLTPTSPTEVLNLLAELPNKKSSGYDKINNILLKNLKLELAGPLSIVFNKSMNEGIFPEAMKLADTVPLYKSKELYIIDNYRPILLLITLSKILEKLIHK